MTDEQDQLPDIVSLITIKGGAAVELFDHELHRVIENVADLNTDAEEAREITLKVRFLPDIDRQAVAYAITCKATKLSGVKSQLGMAYVGRRDGALIAVEYDPKQVDMFDPDAGADIHAISDHQEEETG